MRQTRTRIVVTMSSCVYRLLEDMPRESPVHLAHNLLVEILEADGGFQTTRRSCIAITVRELPVLPQRLESYYWMDRHASYVVVDATTEHVLEGSGDLKV